MGVLKTSGLTIFDIAVLDSIDRAQPFAPAPSAIGVAGRLRLPALGVPPRPRVRVLGARSEADHPEHAEPVSGNYGGESHTFGRVAAARAV